jgi:uncharacterized membrane protein
MDVSEVWPGKAGAPMKKNHDRIRVWEIDFLRGVAVIMMAAFHTVFDLAVYFNVPVSYQSGFWYYIGTASAILFIFISGVSSTFSKNPSKRGILVFGCGMIITLVSIPLMGEYYIRFGILHFLGAAMILKGILDKTVRNKTAVLVIAAALVPVAYFTGRRFYGMYTEIPYLFPLGLVTRWFKSYDYYPSFPWIGLFSAGIAAGMLFNKLSLPAWGAIRNSRLMFYAANFAKPFCFIGRNSLIVYMLHQPVIIAVLYFIFIALV